MKSSPFYFYSELPLRFWFGMWNLLYNHQRSLGLDISVFSD